MEPFLEMGKKDTSSKKEKEKKPRKKKTERSTTTKTISISAKEICISLPKHLTKTSSSVSFKMPPLQIPRIVSDASKVFIIAIDVGVINPAICVRSLDPSIKNPVFAEKSNMLDMPHLGAGFNKYSEKNAKTMVWEWLQTRWEKWFMRAALVGVEKQLCEPLQIGIQQPRACLIVETILESFLHSRLPEGGPLYVSIAPRTWKTGVGILVGHHGSSEESSDEGGGGGGPKNIIVRKNYDENKQRSRSHFFSAYSKDDPEVRHMVDTLKVPISTDVIEAFYIARYMHQNFESLHKKAHNLYSDLRRTDGTRLNVTEKARPVPPLPRSIMPVLPGGGAMSGA